MGLYTHTTRAEGTVLTGSGSSSNIFNVDHQNHVTHTEPTSINSWEPNLTTMNIETSPGTPAAPSLPASLSDELERIRYVLSKLKAALSSGGSSALHWYTKLSGFTAFASFPATASRLEMTVAQQIPHNTLTQLFFDTTIYDTSAAAGGPSMVANGRFVAPATGIYIVGVCVGFGDGVSQGPQGEFQLSLVRNATAGSSAGSIAMDQIFSGATSMPKAITCETIAKFSATDTLTAQVLQTDGSTKTVLSAATARPAMWMAMIGRA